MMSHIAKAGEPPRPIAMVLKDGEPKPVFGRAVFTVGFDFGDHVVMDSEVKGVVIGFCFYPHGRQIQVSWWNNGTVIEQWFADWRIRLE